MTTKEANKKICPHIRAVNFGGWSVDNGDPANIQCIADKCMAWHWHIDDSEYPDGKLKFSNNNGYCRLIHEGEL